MNKRVAGRFPIMKLRWFSYFYLIYMIMLNHKVLPFQMFSLFIVSFPSPSYFCWYQWCFFFFVCGKHALYKFNGFFSSFRFNHVEIANSCILHLTGAKYSYAFDLLINLSGCFETASLYGVSYPRIEQPFMIRYGFHWCYCCSVIYILPISSIN